jgi:hypothetical protein
MPGKYIGSAYSRRPYRNSAQMAVQYQWRRCMERYNSYRYYLYKPGTQLTRNLLVQGSGAERRVSRSKQRPYCRNCQPNNRWWHCVRRRQCLSGIYFRPSYSQRPCRECLNLAGKQQLAGATWSNLGNTNTTFTAGALNTPITFWFRAQVQSGACAVAYSAHTVVIVNPTTVAGAVGGGTTPICIGSPTGIMTLAGHTGSVIRWERRLGGAGPWTTIANITTTHNETPATVGSWEFRAIVRSGVCTELASTCPNNSRKPTISGWFGIGWYNSNMLRHSNRHNDPVGPYWLNSTLGETSRRRRMVNHIKYNNNTLRNTLCLRIMELPCNIAERRLSRSTIG